MYSSPEGWGLILHMLFHSLNSHIMAAVCSCVKLSPVPGVPSAPFWDYIAVIYFPLSKLVLKAFWKISAEIKVWLFLQFCRRSLQMQRVWYYCDFVAVLLISYTAYEFSLVFFTCETEVLTQGLLIQIPLQTVELWSRHALWFRLFRFFQVPSLASCDL